MSLSSFSASGVTCGAVACLVSVNNQIFNANDVAKATLSNNIGLELLGKYKRDAITVYGGYLYSARLMNPSDDYLGGFQTIRSGHFWFPPAPSSKAFSPTPPSPTTTTTSRKS